MNVQSLPLCRLKYLFLTHFFDLLPPPVGAFLGRATGSTLEPVGSMNGMPSLCPTPEVLEHPVLDVIKGFFANYTSVIISKTAEERI